MNPTEQRVLEYVRKHGPGCLSQDVATGCKITRKNAWSLLDMLCVRGLLRYRSGPRKSKLWEAGEQPRASGPSGPSGKHKHALRALSGIPDAEWEQYAAAARADGVTRMGWIRETLRERMQRM